MPLITAAATRTIRSMSAESSFRTWVRELQKEGRPRRRRPALGVGPGRHGRHVWVAVFLTANGRLHATFLSRAPSERRRSRAGSLRQQQLPQIEFYGLATALPVMNCDRRNLISRMPIEKPEKRR